MADIITSSLSPGSQTSTFTRYVGHGRDGEWRLTGIGLTPSVALAEDGSNKWVVAITDGTNTVATSFDTSTSGNALVLGVGHQMTMSSDHALEFGPTDSVKFVCTLTGSATLHAQFNCQWQKVRS